VFGPGSTIRVIGHRGAAAVAPENTLPGFRHAREVGAHGVELDLQCSRDGRLVVIHDPTVDRTTDGTGRVEELDLEALQELDAGHAFSPDHGRSHPYRGQGVRIPTLDEVLEAVGDLAVVAEVKSRRAGEAMGRWLRSGGEERRERILVGGFEREFVDPARRHARWSCAYQTELLPYVLLGKIGLGRRFAPGADAAMVPERHRSIRVVSRGFVRRCHRDGLGVFVWTVNRTEDARRLFDWNVDGIVSDAPGRILRVLHERRAAGDLAEGEPPAPSGTTAADAEATDPGR
jgi:glycerophosphoryl diester phosphodiesterase